MQASICQSCSRLLVLEEDKGTTKAGIKSEEYCSYCFQDGAFMQDITLEQAIEQCVEYADMAGATKEEARVYANEIFPTLKRWKQD